MDDRSGFLVVDGETNEFHFTNHRFIALDIYMGLAKSGKRCQLYATRRLADSHGDADELLKDMERK